jgi:glucosamine-6-phosphate deaminase
MWILYLSLFTPPFCPETEVPRTGIKRERKISKYFDITEIFGEDRKLNFEFIALHLCKINEYRFIGSILIIFNKMVIDISDNPVEAGRKAAGLIAEALNYSIAISGEARMVVSTGSSQFEMFQSLIREDIDWKKIEVFHLDEYIGIPVSHIASFRKYLLERFISQVPVKRFHAVDVEGDIDFRIETLTNELRRKQVDLGVIGIGVNGHIAFNDPPADFQTREAYIKVKLDEQCKLQQVNEGWFGSIGEVPDMAVSMSVWQIMQCRKIISVVPHKVKANAVYRALSESLTSNVPASVLKTHPDWTLFLDMNSASELIRF